MGKTKVEIVCANCEIKFLKELSKINYNKKLGRKNCCSLSCAVKLKPTKSKNRTMIKLHCNSCEEYFIIEKRKYNLNQKRSINSKTETKRFNMGSVDRIDSSKPYIKGNIVFVSMLVNFMKNNLSVDDVVEFIDIMSKYVSKTNIEEIKENIKKLQNL